MIFLKVTDGNGKSIFSGSTVDLNDSFLKGVASRIFWSSAEEINISVEKLYKIDEPRTLLDSQKIIDTLLDLAIEEAGRLEAIEEAKICDLKKYSGPLPRDLISMVANIDDIDDLSGLADYVETLIAVKKSHFNVGRYQRWKSLLEEMKNGGEK